MIKIGIVGGTGYADVELLRLPAQHPQVRMEVIISRSEAKMKVADIYPDLRGRCNDLQFSVLDVQRLGACDAMFLATPHGVTHMPAGEPLDAGTQVIDLFADFHLVDTEEWARWYGQPHGAPALLGRAVYGLSEINYEKIRQARLIAMPSCYPTATQLGLIPLLKAGLADASRLIVDCKPGISGAGQGVKVSSPFCEAGESVMAYAVKGHRHFPKTSQSLRRASGGEAGLTFVPYLTPMICSIHAALYAHVADRSVDLQALLEKRCADEPFVGVMSAGSHSEARNVCGTNVCQTTVHRPQSGDLMMVLSVIDNLAKGVSGQMLQNMNILLGLDERLGLSHAALLP